MAKGYKILMLLDNDLKSDARVEKEVETLITAGFRVEVACMTNQKLPVQEDRNGFKITRLLDPIFKAPFRKGYKDYMNKTAGEIAQMQFDVLHCHDYHMAILGTLVKKLSPEKVFIYDSHEYLPGWPIYKTSKGLLNRLKAYLVWRKNLIDEARALEQCDYLVTITQAIGSAFATQAKLKHPPVIVRNIPNKTIVQPVQGYFHSKYSLPANAKVMIYSGTVFHTDKQLKFLFDAIFKFPELHLVFMGNWKRLEEVKQIVSGNETLNKKIFFHDYIDNQNERLNYIAAADIGLMHILDNLEAHRIGFSNKFMDYVMAGIPVIASMQDECVRIGTEHNFGSFYHCNSRSELFTAIEKTLNNYTLFKQNVLVARELYNWENESRGLVDLYNSL